MILTYTAICYAIFKIFKVPVNKWTIPTAALGGIILITMILLIMNYNHPFTRDARIYFATTPIIPVVRGEVVDVPVTPNVPLKKGDVLFQIDRQPYEIHRRAKARRARGGRAERASAEGSIGRGAGQRRRGCGFP
jgi:multidrug resistance efflux pump